MDNSEIISCLTRLLAESRIEKVIEILIYSLEPIDSALFDEIVLVSGRYNHLINREIVGVISNELALIEFARINQSAIYLLRKLTRVNKEIFLLPEHNEFLGNLMKNNPLYSNPARDDFDLLTRGFITDKNLQKILSNYIVEILKDIENFINKREFDLELLMVVALRLARTDLFLLKHK